MDFSWSDEQRELGEGAERFARGRLREGIVERDRQGHFDRDLWQACAEFGVQGLPIPVEHGGGGQDPLALVAILEGLGRGGLDNGLLFSIGAQLWACTTPIIKFGSEEQRRRYLPALASGACIAANGMSEPGSGSDAYALRTTATRDNDDYLLNGQKTFVTNAPVADLFVLYARTGGKGFSGITCFLVEKGTPGLSVGPPFQKMGLRTSPMAEVFLDECRVSSSAVLGRPGSGSMAFNYSMDWERLFIMAPALGAMQRIHDRCLEQVKTRTVGDQPLCKQQVIAHRLVDMDMRLEQARWLLYRAAWLKGQRGLAMAESARAKLAVSEAYVQGCREAMQLFGGYGYMTEYELERELRDALASTLYSGTSEVQRNIIAALKGL